MYGLRRVCLPVTGFLLSASTIHLLNLPSETSGQHLSQGMRDLQTMSTNHSFAGRCVDIIRSLATKWQITLPEDAPCASPRPHLNGRKISSPKSAFYSASIPRQNSSQSGTRSAESQESQSRKQSAPGHEDSPFAPPIHSSLSQSQSQTPSSGANSDFFGNQYPSIDQISGGQQQQQQQYWIPFPVQSMPHAHLADLQSTNSLNYLVPQRISSGRSSTTCHPPRTRSFNSIFNNNSRLVSSMPRRASTVLWATHTRIGTGSFLEEKVMFDFPLLSTAAGQTLHACERNESLMSSIDFFLVLVLSFSTRSI